MKNLQLTADNVLFEIEGKKTFIFIPGAKEKQSQKTITKISVYSVGDNVKLLKAGDEVIIDPLQVNILIKNGMSNDFLDIKFKNTEDEEKAPLFVIGKEYQVVAIVK